MDGDVLPWRAMAQSPLRFLGSSAPWRAWLYVATGALFGAAALVGVLALTVLGIALAPVLVGLPILGAVGLSGVLVGAVERRRLRMLGGPAPASPHRTLRGGGLRPWLRTRTEETATWREFAHTMLLVTGLWLVDYAAAALPLASLVLLVSPLVYAVFAGPNGMVLLGVELPSLGATLAATALAIPALVVSAYVVAAAAGIHAAAARVLLLGSAVGDLDPRAMELVRSNGRLVDAFDAERQRIERDLHDGAQQRLVALTVMLDLARMRAEGVPELAELVSRAHLEATITLSELRRLVQGIHPRVLAERGLPDAIADLVTAYPLPTEVRVRIAGRLPPTVESAAFFVISEALANIAKHSDAGSAWITGQVAGDVLLLEVGDTGRGGVDPAAGSGVRGLADRVTAIGGRLLLSSPRGGPTVLRAEIPCLPVEA